MTQVKTDTTRSPWRCCFRSRRSRRSRRPRQRVQAAASAGPGQGVAPGPVCPRLTWPSSTGSRGPGRQRGRGLPAGREESAAAWGCAYPSLGRVRPALTPHRTGIRRSWGCCLSAGEPGHEAAFWGLSFLPCRMGTGKTPTTSPCEGLILEVAHSSADPVPVLASVGGPGPSLRVSRVPGAPLCPVLPRV